MKKLLLIILLVLSLYPISYILYPISADELEDLQKQIDELNQARKLSESATKPLEGQLESLKRQLAQIQASLNHLSSNIQKKEKELKIREEKLAELTAIFEKRVFEDYKNSYIYTPLGFIFGDSKLSDKLYHLKTINENRGIIKNISGEVIDLLVEKERLEKDKAHLDSLQAQVDKNAAFLGGEVATAKKYQTELSSKIAQLSARQQQIIAARQASLNLPTSLGAGTLSCSDDRDNKYDPGFRPAFAFFTFGIPHRVGMNQYGALGRSQAGQNHEEILRAYFDNFEFQKKDNINISVSGFGSMPLETYLLGIYEMPDSWPMEALKAQAIAARSYALAYTGNGSKEICTTQACQVYKGGNKGGNWEQAVKATEGIVMASGGNPISAWYASTAGGYTFTSSDVGWGSRPWTKRVRDTQGDIGSISDLLSKAYDKDSPCFYAAQGFRSQYAKSAWLKSEEVADIVNVILLTKRDGGVSSHIYQIDKPNPEGADTWDMEKVKIELKSRGGNPFNSVSGVEVSLDFGSGTTSSVTISGDAGSETISASEFRNFFNLRAPANISIVGPLFNIEKK